MRALIVDRDPEFRKLLRYHCEVEWPSCFLSETAELPSVETGEGGSPDVLLLGADASEVLGLIEKLRTAKRCPLIAFVANGSEAVAVAAMRGGADYYFPKKDLRHRQLVEIIREMIGEDTVESTAELLGIGENGLVKGRRLVRRLHAGDFAVVHLAEDLATGDPVVLKVLKQVPAFDTDDDRAFRRFLQEYELIAAVVHPNIVAIQELSVADDHAVIAMEYLGGGSLSQRMREPVARTEALEVVAQIASALEAIHDVGVLHRDLKPGNVMLRESGTVALIDFGIATQWRLKKDISGGLEIFGTPHYMSPEQGHGDPMDQRSDLYSLGVMLYEMLAGVKPFRAASPFALIYQHAQSDRPRLPEEHADLEPFVHRLMAAKPDDRFADAAAVAKAVESLR